MQRQGSPVLVFINYHIVNSCYDLIIGKEHNKKETKREHSEFESECESAKLAQITIDHDQTPANSDLSCIEDDRPTRGKVLGTIQRRIQRNILEPNNEAPLNFQKSI